MKKVLLFFLFIIPFSITTSAQCCNGAAHTNTFGGVSCPGTPTSTNPTLTWSGAGACSRHQIYISKYPYFTPNLIQNYNTSAPNNTSPTCVTGNSHTASSPGLQTGMVYRWQLEGTNVCHSTCTSNISALRHFHINPVINTSGPTTFCWGGSVTLSTPGRSVNSPGSISYQWERNGSPVGGNSASYTATQSGSYQVLVTFSGSTSTGFPASPVCSSTTISSNTITVTEQTNSTAPSSASASPGTICSGASTTLTKTGGSLGTGASYNWYSGSCGGTLEGTGSSISVSPTSSTTYYVRAEGTCNTTSCVSVTVTVISVSTAPSSASASPNSFCAGGSSTLTRSGGSLGAGASWNWYSGSCGGTPEGTGSSISVSPTSTTTYFVRAEGTCNNTSCASVTVTVNTLSTAPTSATASPNPICSGSTMLTQNGGSLGTGASYNWYTGSCGGTLVGAGSSITVSPTSTTTYFVLAQGVCNTTACASVTVILSTPSIAPSSASASPGTSCAGAPVTLTQIGGTLGAGAFYAWYSGSCGGTPEGTGSSISVSPTSTTTYFVRAEGACNNTACASVTVTVNPLPFATATPSSQTICCGSSTSIALSSFTPGTTFSWTVAQNGVSGASAGLGASIAQSLCTTGASPGTATYSITPTANGCAGNPITVVITVNPTPIVTASPSQQTICSGLTPSTSLTSNVSGATFTWTVVQTGVSGGTNSSGSTIAETLIATGSTAGTATYTITPTANGCPGAPITVTITVNPMPIATTTPASQTVCSGNATSIALTSNVAGSSFAWTVVQTGGVSGGTNGTGTAIADILTTTTTGTAVYTITPTANSCVGSATTVTITVNPKDDASFSYSAATYCQTGNDPSATITGLSGGLFSSTSGLVFLNTSTGLIDLSASTLGTYTITYTTNGTCPNTYTVTFTITPSPATGFSYPGTPFCQYGSNLSPTFVPGAFAGTFSATPSGLVFVNANTGVIDLPASTPGTYTIKNIIVASGGCSADSATTNVTINLAPAATATPSPQTICSGTATAIALTSTLPGTTYNWTVVQTNVTGAAPGSGSSIAQILTATGVGAGTAIYSIAPAVGSCVGLPITDTVTVNPGPVTASTPTAQTICSGNSSSIALSSNITGTAFFWVASLTGATGAAFGWGSPISQPLISTGTIPGSAIYTIAPSANGCSGNAVIDTVTVNPPDNASFVYTSATYCQNGANPTPTITGLQGGTFSSTPAGLSLNPATGAINLAASTLGVYPLCYATNGTCPNTSCITMTITNTTPLANFTYSSASYCQNGTPDPSPIFGSGASAGIFSASPAGLVFVHVNTGQIDLSASATGSYTVVNYIPPSGTCGADTATTTVTITTADNASFTYPSATYCVSGTNPTPVITGLPGGTFSSAPSGLSVNPTTGTINLSASALGSYTISYATFGPCPNTSSITMTINSVSPSADFSYYGSPFCQYGNNPAPVFVSGASAGVFSAVPAGLAFVHVNTGQINLSLSTPGTYVVTNLIPVSGSCMAVSTTTMVVIAPAPAATASTGGSQTICGGATIPVAIALSSNMPGTAFTWTVFQTGLSGAVAGSGSAITQTLTFIGPNQGTATYTITPSANGCIGLPITVNITVYQSPVADTSAVVIAPANCGTATGTVTGIITTSGLNPIVYQWHDSQGNLVGSNSANLSNVVPGNYFLTITDANNCSIVTGPYAIPSTPAVVAAFSAAPVTGETPLTVTFTNSSTGAATYLWEFGTGDVSTETNLSYVYKPLGKFQACLTATSATNCKDTLCDTIDIYINSAFIIPNIFTPNDDNINDIFTLTGTGLKTVDAEIFNRWGQKEYVWHAVNGGWDGRTASGVRAPSATYYYIIKIKGIDGKEYLEKGSFQLITDK